MLAVGTASETRAERFLELLRVGARQARRRAAAVRAAVEQLLARVFAGDPPPKFALGREVPHARPRRRQELRALERDRSHARQRAPLRQGRHGAHASRHSSSASALSGVLDANGALGKLKLVGLDEAADEAAEGAEEPLARLDAELALLGGTLRQLVVGLRQALDG